MNLSDFLNKYPGEWTIVGKGKTAFDYANLQRANGPVIFINDAVQFERQAAHVPRFFFAHDRTMECWLDQIESLAVLPFENPDASHAREMIHYNAANGRAVGYVWDDAWKAYPAHVLDVSREDVAHDWKLFLGSGTIHSAIHFAWYAGATAIHFVGCDGVNNSTAKGQTYDDRLVDVSGAVPKGCYSKIKHVQDWLCKKLRVDAIYEIGKDWGQVIPEKLHFVWLGGRMPRQALDNLAGFVDLNPGWHVNIWTGKPANLPSELSALYDSCELYCQRADIVRYWRLFEYGGIYADLDMIPVQPLSSLTRYRAWACPQADDRLNNAAIGSVPKSPAMTAVLQALPAQAESMKRARYGPDLLTKLRAEFVELPRETVYPFPTPGIVEKWRNRELPTPDGCYMVHMWGIDGSGKRRVDDGLA